MVEPLCFRACRTAAPPVAALFLAVLAAGCFDVDDGIHHDDDAFIHRTYTAWQPLPSKDGDRLALVLEPRRVDADSHGVMITGWHGEVVGDGVVVVGSDPARARLTNVPRGFMDADWDLDTLFVWTKAAWTWTPVAPNDMPPSAIPYATVTMLDRGSFAPKGSRTFDPPLEMPLAVGNGFILDLPRFGASDVERPLRIALHDTAKTGAGEVLHEGRGSTSFTCGRGSSITVAYQRGAKAMTVVDVVVVDGRAHVAKLDLDDFIADGVACRRNGHHVALVGGRPSTREGRAVVLERSKEGDALTIAFENSVKLPAVLSRDGRALLAAGPNGEALFVTKKGAQILAGVPALQIGRVAFSGDRAFVAGNDKMKKSAIVHLDNAEEVSPPQVTLVSKQNSESQHTMQATDEGAFLVYETKYDNAHYADEVLRASVVDEKGAVTDIPALAGYLDPTMAWSDARRAYLVADRVEPAGTTTPGGLGTGKLVELVEVDLVAKTVAKTIPFPLCDRAAMQTQARCFP